MKNFLLFTGCLIESQNGLSWKRSSKVICSSSLAMKREEGHLQLHQVLGVQSRLTLSVSRDRASTISPDNLCQCFTTLIIIICFFISSLNLLFFRLKPFPLVLSQQSLLKRGLKALQKHLQIELRYLFLRSFLCTCKIQVFA